MRPLPLFSDLRHKRCLVVGGGTLAERRVMLLREAGALVTVIAPALDSQTLGELAAENEIEHVAEVYASQPLACSWIATTDARAVNARVAADAAAARRFCNGVDDASLCSFVMPAIVDRSPVTIAIGSSGLSPTLARWIKGLIETLLPARLGALAELAGKWREPVRTAVPDVAERRQFW